MKKKFILGTNFSKMNKIAFTFLVVRTLNHPGVWTNFFKSVSSEKYNIYIHSKCNISDKIKSFEKYIIPNPVATEWQYTVYAQIELLKHALKDLNNQKFVLLSESCIPLFSFDYIYENLNQDVRTRMKYISLLKSHDKRCDNTKQVRDKYLPKTHTYYNHQWIILNRQHAEMMVQDIEILPQIANKCFADNEFYPSVFFYKNNLLNDENIKNQMTTYVDWSRPAINRRHPYQFKVWNQDDQERLLKAQNNDCLFARKFLPSWSEDAILRHLRSK